jgi:hypothetical protein
MSMKAKLLYVSAALLLIGPSLSGLAQTSKPTLDSSVSQGVAEIDDLHSATVGEWAIRHPGEILATPADKGDPRKCVEAKCAGTTGQEVGRTLVLTVHC